MQVEFGEALILADRAPVAHVQERLRDRSEKISFWLQAAGERHAIGEIGAVLATMSMRSGSTDDIEKVMRIYAADLADLPAFALSGACKAFRQGKAGDGKWAPTQAEIRAEAERQIEPLTREKAKIDQVLIARPVRDNPVRKGRIDHLVSVTLGELRHASKVGRAPRGGMSAGELAQAERIAAAVAAGQAISEPLPPLSPTLRHSLNLQDPETDRSVMS